MTFNNTISCFTCLLVVILLCPCQALAEPSISKRDTNGDGKIDQIIHVDGKGHIEKLEIDKDGDGVMEIFQVYENDQVVRIERDSDGDGGIDAWDDFQDGMRVRHRHLSIKTGKTDLIVLFDSEERPKEIRKDTSGDGILESVYNYTAGRLTLYTKDTDGDSRPNVTQTYNGEPPLERREDRDGDGHWERIVLFDPAGLTRESHHDLDDDGHPDLREHYDEKGKLFKSEEEKEVNGSTLTWFYSAAEEAVRAEKDTNRDGKVDTWYFYDQGRLVRVEEDTNEDGKADLWEYYDASEAIIKRSKDLNHDGLADVEEVF